MSVSEGENKTEFISRLVFVPLENRKNSSRYRHVLASYNTSKKFL